MKLTWLGQAGYLLRTSSGMTIMIDPYMSDSLLEAAGEGYRREVPVDEDILNMKLDFMIVTHPHGDHMDFGTLDVIFKNNPGMYVLSAYKTQFAMRERYGGELHYMLFDAGAEINLPGIRFVSRYAMHCEGSIGAVIQADGQLVCHTGDTMLCTRLYDEYPKGADALILPINGKGNNMTAMDAAKLTEALAPKSVYPMHFDMFRKYGCDPAEFTGALGSACASRVVIPTHYEEREI